MKNFNKELYDELRWEVKEPLQVQKELDNYIFYDFDDERVPSVTKDYIYIGEYSKEEIITTLVVVVMDKLAEQVEEFNNLKELFRGKHD